MNIGVLDTRCRIEQKVVTYDPEYGTELVGWAPLAVVWCSVQDELPSRSEAVKMGVEINTNRARVRMNYRTDINPSMRLVIYRPGEVVYEIVAGPAVLGHKDGIEVFVERFSS